MTASLQVGRLSVHPHRSSLGQDVVARHRAEALLAALDLPPPDPLDHGVLVLRAVQWTANRGLAAAARTEVAQLARAAVRPAEARAAHADAVLFRDDVDLLRCLTLDALSGQLSRWYWRRLAPARSGRIGAILTAAWTERARWLPAALTDLPVTDAIRAVSTLSSDEVRLVRESLFVAFDVHDPPTPPAANQQSTPGSSAPIPDEPPTPIAATDQTATTMPTEAADPTDPLHHGEPMMAVPSASWLPALESSGLDGQHCRLLLLALGLRHQPGTIRREPEASLHEVLRGIAAAKEVKPARPRPATPPSTDAHQTVVWDQHHAGALADANKSDAADQHHMAPHADAHKSVTADQHHATPHARAHEPVQDPQQATPSPSAPQQAKPSPSAEPVIELAPHRPAFFDASSGVFSRYASALYLINVASWLHLLVSWVGVELLARHLLGSVEPASEWPGSLERGSSDMATDEWDRDPLWAVLAELDGREPGSEAVDPGWSPLVGALAISALADRAIPASALMQPGRIVVTATHVDVVLDLQAVDIHARIAGLDRDPGWVPDLARIVAFHFEDGNCR
jgi:hypothetical protein